MKQKMPQTRISLIYFILNNSDEEVVKDWAENYLNGLPTSILEEEAAKHIEE